MINIDRFTDIAANFKVSTERAEEIGIIRSSDIGIHITSSTFEDIVGSRKYNIKKREDTEYPYEYSTKITGLEFYCISPYLMFEGDKDLLKN